MRDKICIVTGASSGIGKRTALELAKLGASVLMMARSQEGGESAKSEIATKSHNSAMEFLPASPSMRFILES